ncbi:MAG: hypothetical protein SGPRY_008958, partial [Prymnesium sp.]
MDESNARSFNAITLALSSKENAEALYRDLLSFMASTSHIAGRNMDHNVAGSNSDQPSPQVEHELVVASDRRRKNVDSGKVAIIYCTDSVASFKEKWSGTSKERRRWIADVLRQDKALGAKLIFIEVIVNKPEIIEANIRAKRRALDQGEATAADMRNHYNHVKLYQRMYVTLQDDGSEDDLSYIKLINYGGKIGGNPPLSGPGNEYSKRLGAWVPQNICQVGDKVVKCRLWTSSLQAKMDAAQGRSISKRLSLTPPRLPSERDLKGMDAVKMPGEVDDSGTDAWEQMSPRVYRNLGTFLASPKAASGLGDTGLDSLHGHENSAMADEIFAGEYEGMTYEDIKRLQPDEAALRSMDKIGYRYPRGESYFDLLARLDPLVHEMESFHEPLLVVSHQ